MATSNPANVLTTQGMIVYYGTLTAYYGGIAFLIYYQLNRVSKRT